jgi:O-antigen/teichoic acid export membrane protein
MNLAVVRRAFGGRDVRSLVLTNLAARIGAFAAVAVATLLVARTGGPVWVGALVLLRVLPSVAGFLGTGAIPAAAPYFLADGRRDRPRLRATLVGVTLVGGVVGAIAWLALAVVASRAVFPELAPGLVAVCAVLVISQIVVSTGKACCQGDGDLPGSSMVILIEEISFLPIFGVLWTLGLRDGPLIILSLLGADLITAAVAWTRLSRRGFHRPGLAVDLRLAREVWTFGMRGEVGSMLLLVNLRLDFLIVEGVAGPAALGIYAVASKYAELLRVPSDAALWVLYPHFARDHSVGSATSPRTMMRRVGGAVAAGAVPLAVLSPLVVPSLYGAAFAAAVIPACILLMGLAGEGLAAVAVGYLYGQGRPGLASAATAAGVGVTVVLDVLLIPRMGVTGAAVASTAAYISSTAACVALFMRKTSVPGPALRRAPAQEARS